MEETTKHFQPNWIGLALSGGGFRATLFHLGVIRQLRDCDLLSRVKLICSVSGGSILAAHLVLNWDKYLGTEEEFSRASTALIKLARIDVRNRILRRWLAASLFMLPRLSGRFNCTALLRGYFDDLYGNAMLEQLGSSKSTPDIHILTTSLTTGNLCKFTSRGFEVVDERNPKAISMTSLRVSLAVAASSAFPPMFPAITIDHNILNAAEIDFKIPHSLADGGVFDNSGFHELSRLSNSYSSPGGLLITSNAGANFDSSIRKKYSFVLSLARNVRANEIMMHRYSKLITASTPDSHRICRIDMHTDLATENTPPNLSPQMQRSARNMRTDLNRFSDIAINSLVSYGYAKARAALQEANVCARVVSDWPPFMKHIPASAKRELKIQEVKGRDWLRLFFAPNDIAMWFCLLALAIWCSWPFLLLHVRYRREHFKEEALASSLRDQVTLYQEANTELQKVIPTRVYRLKVIDPLRDPIPNAEIHVATQDGSHTIASGRTGADGSFSFEWKPVSATAQAHVYVNAPGFWTMSDWVDPLSEHDVHVIQLNRGD